MSDRAPFFAAIRPLFGRLSQSQVDGLNFILDAAETERCDDPRWLAYALGTAFHETAQTMQPIKEYGGAAYFHRMYDPASPDPRRAALAAREGARPGDGVRYFGRGYVQLTWRANYRRMGQLLGLPLEANPDLALNPSIAARVMFVGMRGGLFTGRKFADYFKPDGATDWVNARRIINGTDKAAEIAAHSVRFHQALMA